MMSWICFETVRGCGVAGAIDETTLVMNWLLDLGNGYLGPC